MKHLILAAAAASIALAGQAGATDLPKTINPFSSKVTTSDPFNGPYISLYGGGIMTGSAVKDEDFSFAAKGWEIGLRAGYDHRLPGTQFIAGIYAEGGFSRVTGDIEEGASIQHTNQYGLGLKGGVSTGNTLFYSTVGWVHENAKVPDVHLSNPDGVRLGLGVEHVFNNGFSVSFEPSWTLWSDLKADDVKVEQESLGVRLAVSKRF